MNAGQAWEQQQAERLNTLALMAAMVHGTRQALTVELCAARAREIYKTVEDQEYPAPPRTLASDLKEDR